MNQLLQTIFQSRNADVETIGIGLAQSDELTGDKESPGIFNELFSPLNIQLNSPG